MKSLDYDPGVLYGDRRDHSLRWNSLIGLDDLSFGKLIKALGRTAAVFRESERAAHAQGIETALSIHSTEELDERIKAQRKFSKHMDVVDGFIGKVITEAIGFANLRPSRPALYAKDVIFKEDEPVLYFEHWGTEDLDEPDRDLTEIQMFVGLNGHLETEAGKTLAHSVLERLFSASYMSEKNIPDTFHTFGTVQPEVFEPVLLKVPTEG